MNSSGFPHLRQLRTDIGMTQEAFAESIGISKTTYNNYETGAREPRSDFWEKVSREYNVTVDFLLGLSNEKHNSPKIKNSPTSVQSKAGEKDIFADELIENYKALNREGQRKLIDYSKDLISGGRYAALKEDAV